MTQSHTEEVLSYAGVDLQMLKAGNGPPLLVLHGAGGNPGFTPYHHALAERFTVYAPSHPGFDGSSRPPWIDSIVAVSHFYLGLVDEMGLDRFSLMGFSMGGWIAAEMAAMAPARLDRLVLVAAVGVKPGNGRIAELFNVSRDDVSKLRFFDTAQVPNYDETYGREMTRAEADVERRNRETAARWCWQPYMHNPNLPHYLTKVRAPTLVVWGREDAIAPVECAEAYGQAIPNSRLRVIDRCGHIPQVEKPREFLDAVIPFLSDPQPA